MRTNVKYILELIRDGYITLDEGTDRILNLFGVSNNTCDQIFEQASKSDDYEFHLHKHWKDEDDRTGFDSNA